MTTPDDDKPDLSDEEVLTLMVLGLRTELKKVEHERDTLMDIFLEKSDKPKE